MPGLRSLLVSLLGRLAADTGDRAGAALGVLAFHLGVRRAVVSDNLARCLGLGGPARRRIARRSYASMGANFVVMWSIGRPWGPEHGVELWAPAWQRAQFQRHPSVVFLTLHLGCWEMAARAVRLTWPRVLAYAKAQHDAAMDELINRQRAAAGIDVVMARHGERTSAVTVLRALRAPVALGLLADQKPSADEGEPGWLFGVPTSCHRGPAFFARRAGVPLVMGFGLRLGAGRYRFFMGRPAMPDACGEAALRQHAMDQVAAVAAAFPGQYFWHHRRFKGRPVELPPRSSQPWRERGVRLLADAPPPG
ncbi:MAG TPA: lysophospholipid acyltransferase family protein [Planctomycetota bacterium]|nr:lysophospholipid acyltransferase family protein [Planctomycetota bacterium]